MKTTTAPKIDLRTQQDLVRQIRYLIEQYSAPSNGDQVSLVKDPQVNTLVYIFSRLMEINIQRLNKALDKNFVAFLDLLGISLAPPRAARVPLRFSLAEGTNQHVFVKQRTQVAAENSPDDKPVVFETAGNITVILPQLIRAISLSPENDRWSDHSPTFFDEEKEGYETLYKGKHLTPHRLYIGDSESFLFKDTKSILLRIKVNDSFRSPSARKSMERFKKLVKWYHFSADSLEPVPLKIDFDDNQYYDPMVVNLQKSGIIPFVGVSEIVENPLTGFERKDAQKKTWTSNWIFAELQSPVNDKTFPEIYSIESRIDHDLSTENPPFLPDLALFDQHPLDLTKDFYPFGQNPGFNSTFYLASAEAFQHENARITIEVTLSKELENSKTEAITLSWEYWDGTEWAELGKTTQEGVVSNKDSFSDGTNAFTKKNDGKSSTIEFPCPPIKPVKVNGKENLWLRVRIVSGSYTIEAGSTTRTHTDYSLSSSFFDELNEIKIIDKEQLSEKQLKIFDELRNQSFHDLEQIHNYIFSMLSDFNLPKIFFKLIYHLADEHRTESKYPPPREEYYLEDRFFMELEELSFTTTTDLSDQEIKNLSSLESNTYTSREQAIEAVIKKAKEIKIHDNLLPLIEDLIKDPIEGFIESEIETTEEYVEESLFPPSIEKMMLSYETVTFNEVEQVLTYNDFRYHTGKEDRDSQYESVVPFLSIQDQYRSLYLGFNQSIADLPVNLFFPLVSEGLVSPLVDEDSTLPVLSWEYWNGKFWNALSVDDKTKELTRREMVQLLAPDDLKSSICFGENLYWIRAVLVKGEFPLPIKSASIYANTVWAYNRITVADELLGTSTGAPSQTLSIPHYPVLSGQQLLVRETSLTDDEREIIVTEEGADAVEEILDETGNIKHYWIRWHEVPHFHASTPNSRHYIIGRNEGNIRFGNGVKGMIPAAGKNSIKFKIYQHGGGERGNVEKEQVTKLLSSIPYLDKVSNPLPSEGGVNAETTDRVKTRGPRFLRTRNRAVTSRDYEWIVLEASPKVGRAKCLAVANPLKQFTPGWVTVIIVPNSLENRPMPSEELIDEVKTYLHDRSSFNLVERQQPMINLIPPNYLKIDVNIDVIINSINEAKLVEARLQDRLKTFYHPINGGSKGEGWEFGRDIFITELYETIEKISGVNVVEEITLSAAIQIFRSYLQDPIYTTYLFPQNSRVMFEYGKIIFMLAEKIPANSNITSFKISGFMEGDLVDIFKVATESIELIKSNECLRLTINSIETLKSGVKNVGLLRCAPITSEFDFPTGSIIETCLKKQEYKIRSYTLSPIKAGEEVSELEIALPSPGTNFTVRHRDWFSSNFTVKLDKLISDYEQIYLPADYLVYIGGVSIASKLESETEIDKTTEWPRYVLNRRSLEVHDRQHESPLCNLDLMKQENRIYFHSLDEIKEDIRQGTLDYCAWCFGADLSKR